MCNRAKPNPHNEQITSNLWQSFSSFPICPEIGWHYDQFDSRYKAVLPLKRVYVPAPLDESG